MERRWGSDFEFARATVVKRRRRLKNQEFDFVAKTVLNADVVFLLEKIRLECLHNFLYFATIILLERSMCFFCGLGVSKRIISLGLCGLAIHFPVLGQSPKSGEVQ